MRKRCTIGAALIAIAILGTLLIPNNKIRSPALAKVTVTALAEENGFDERDVKPVKEKSSGKNFMDNCITMVNFHCRCNRCCFLEKDSTLSNKIGERAKRFSQESQANTTENNATANTNSAGGGDTNAEL